MFKTVLFFSEHFFSSLILLLIPSVSSDLSLKQFRFCAYLRFSCEYFLLNDLMFYKFLSKMTCMLFSGCSLCRNFMTDWRMWVMSALGWIMHRYFVSQVAVLRHAAKLTEYSALYIYIIIIFIRSCKHGKLLASNWILLH